METKVLSQDDKVAAKVSTPVTTSFLDVIIRRRN